MIALPIRVTNSRKFYTTELDKWFDSQDLDTQELYTHIQDNTSLFDDETSVLEVESFLDELADYGVQTYDTFESAFFWETDSFNPEADFVEYITTELSEVEIPPYLVVDYKASWDRNYRHDFFVIPFKGNTLFFTNNF